MSRLLSGHMVWWPWPWFKVTLWPSKCEKNYFGIFRTLITVQSWNLHQIVDNNKDFDGHIAFWPLPWFKVTRWPWKCLKWTFGHFHTLTLIPVVTFWKLYHIVANATAFSWTNDMMTLTSIQGHRTREPMLALPFLFIFYFFEIEKKVLGSGGLS